MADPNTQPLLTDPTKDPMKFLGSLLTGFFDAIGKPVADDVAMAYKLQRAARARYPGADGVLNFVPYVGLATNADDIANDVANQAWSDIPGDAAGLALNVASAKMGIKGVTNAAKMAAAQGRNPGRVTLLAGGGPIVAYVSHYKTAQKEADAKYGGSSLLEIAHRMYPNMK